MNNEIVSGINGTVASVKAQIEALTSLLTALQIASASFSPEASKSEEAAPTKPAGLQLKKKATLAKKVTTVAPSTTPKKVTKAALIAAVTEASRLTTGKLAVAFFGGDKEAAKAALTAIADLAYHAKGRGGYWTLADEEASEKT